MYEWSSYMRFLVALTIIASVFTGCQDLSEDEFEIQSTELRVRVIGEDLRPVTTGVVSLYLDIVSFRTRSGEVSVAQIQADGFAYFRDLQPLNYFIYATHSAGAKVFDNQYAFFDLTDYLTENAVTTVTVKTALRREGPPTHIEIHSIDVIPIADNIAYAGPDYDTLRGEFLLIEDYDGGLVADQRILGRVSYELNSKPLFGEILSFPMENSEGGGTIEIPVPALSAGPGVPTDPQKHTYTLYMTCFTSRKEYEQRELVYTGTAGAGFKCITEVINLGSQLLGNTRRLHPWTEYIFAEETRLQRFQYDIYADVLWK